MQLDVAFRIVDFGVLLELPRGGLFADGGLDFFDVYLAEGEVVADGNGGGGACGFTKGNADGHNAEVGVGEVGAADVSAGEQ